MPVTYFGPGWHRWYSDPIHAGWSGDQIPLGVRFSTLVRTGPGAHPASCKMVPGLSWGTAAGAWHWPPTDMAPRFKEEWSYTSAPPLCPFMTYSSMNLTLSFTAKFDTVYTNTHTSRQ